MAVETIGVINDTFELESIYDFITAKYDVSARLFRPNPKEVRRDYCTIAFLYNGKERRISVGISQSPDYECVKSEYYIWMGLGQGEDAIKIISEILQQYGGYIIDNDSIGDYRYIEKAPDKNVKKVFRVTMNEVYEKFGGIVIIENSTGTIHNSDCGFVRGAKYYANITHTP